MLKNPDLSTGVKPLSFLALSYIKTMQNTLRRLEYKQLWITYAQHINRLSTWVLRAYSFYQCSKV